MGISLLTDRFRTQNNGSMNCLKLSWSVYSDSLSGLYLKSYSHHQHHQNFSSSGKTNKNNNAPRISPAPPNPFEWYRTETWTVYSALVPAIQIPYSVWTSKVTLITKNSEITKFLIVRNINNSVGRISPDPTNPFRRYHTGACIIYIALVPSIHIPDPFYILKVTLITKKLETTKLLVIHNSNNSVGWVYPDPPNRFKWYHTGTCIVYGALFPTNQVPYPVYTSKVTLITKIRKSRNSEIFATTVWVGYLQLDWTDLHSILHAFTTALALYIRLFCFLLRYILLRKLQ